MAGNIKGITVEIAGDTTKLGKALASANKEIKNAQSNLKAVDKALKLDPTNVDMLKAKQNALNDVIKETKDKLDMEKEAAESAKKALDAGEISQSQYDALQAEIVQTTKNLEELEKQAKQSASVLGSQMQAAGEKLKEVGNNISQVADKAANVGSELTKKVTAPIVAVGTASTAFAMDFESAMAKLGTIADTNAVPIDELKESILELSDQSGISAAEIAEATYQAISAGQDTKDAVEFVAQANTLAKAGFTDMTTATDTLTTTLNAYGMSADKVSSISDKLITTQNMGKTTVDELGASMGKVIPTAAMYGVNLDQLSAAYVTTTKNGIGTAEATTYINGMFNELGKSGSKASDILLEETGKSFKELMDDGYNLSDVLMIVQDAADESGVSLADMFGSQEAAKAAATITQHTNDFNEAVSALSKSTGTASTAFEKLEESDPTMTMEKAKNSVRNAAITIGEQLVPTLLQLANKIKEVAQWFKNLSPETKEFIIKMAMIAAAVGPVIFVLAKLTGLISNIITVVGVVVGFIGSTVIPALSSVGTVITGTIIPAITAVAGPILAVIAVITAIIVVIKNWKAITELARIVWEALKNAVLNAWDSIKQKWDEAVEFFQGIWDNIQESADFLVQTVAGFFTTCWDNIQIAWEFVIEFFQNIWDSVQAGADLLVQTVTGFFTTAWDNIKLVWDEVTGFFQGVWDGITGIFSSVGSWFSEKFSEGYNNITSLFSGLAGFFSGVWDDITGIFKQIGTTISDAITGSVKSAVNTVLSGAVKIINGFIKAINAAISVINAIPGVKISKITELSAPQLERGGILAKGQVGILEGNGAEAVVPLDQNRKWVRAVAKSFAEELGNQGTLAGAGGTGDIHITVQLGTEDLKKILIKQEQLNNRRSGGR